MPNSHSTPGRERTPSSPHALRASEGPSSPVLSFGSSSVSRDPIPTRSHHRDDPGGRERQRAQDLESAMSMSRARSNSIINSPEDSMPPMLHRHSHAHGHPHYPISEAVDESAFPMLTEAEEAELERSRNTAFGRDNEDDEPTYNDRQGRGERDGSDYDEEEEARDDDAMMMSRSMGRRVSREALGDMMGRRGSDQDRFGGHDRHRSMHEGGMGMGMGMGMSLGEAAQLESARGGMGVSPRLNATQMAMAMMGGMGPTRNVFNFGPMEDFATKERDIISGPASPPNGRRPIQWSGLDQDFRMGAEGTGAPLAPVVVLQAPADEAGPNGSEPSSRRASTKFENSNLLDETMSPEMTGRISGGTELGDNESALGTSPTKSPRMPGDDMENNFVRRRHRKLSNSNALSHPRRQGRLALFEGTGGGLPSEGLPPREGTFTIDVDPNRSGHLGHSPTMPTKAPRIAKNPMLGAGGGGGGGGYTDYPETSAMANRDRPYRFSFYSNALPATIHARSLGELPAEGQTFEDLFAGKGGLGEAAESDSGSTGPPRTVSGSATPVNGELMNGLNGSVPNPKMSLLAKAASAAGGTPPPSKGQELDDPEAKTWWLDVLSPTDEEMRMLAKVFGIHPLTTEDILLEETREKIELFRHYYLVCFRSFDQDPYSQTYLEPLNMYIIVFREGTLSFHFRGTPHPQNVRRRIKSLKDYISVTSDWISYALIDDITDAFGPLIQNIEYEVDGIDELVLILKDTEQSDMLRRIGTCRKKVMGLLRLMGNKADVVKGLAKRCNENWSVAPKSDIGLYLSDIQDHLITMTQNLNHYEKILSRSHSNYLAQISIEMTDANNQINDVLSKLTALGTVLIPMNLVCGLWGMNVHVPGQDADGYAWFAGILGALVLFAIVGGYSTLRFFKS